MTLQSDVLRDEQALAIVGLARALETELSRICEAGGSDGPWSDPVWTPDTVRAREALQDALDDFDGIPRRARGED